MHIIQMNIIIYLQNIDSILPNWCQE